MVKEQWGKFKNIFSPNQTPDIPPDDQISFVPAVFKHHLEEEARRQLSQDESLVAAVRARVQGGQGQPGEKSSGVFWK